MHHALAASLLVWIAVALAIFCAIGVAITRTAFERLHFSAILASLCTALIILAVWLDDPSWQARLKGLFIAILLFVMNGVLSHATARAIRIRQAKRLDIDAGERIPVITQEHPAGIPRKGKS
ncbi:MAG TPA: monovalent cation/H(+) antiporter subunit G [Candidatus Acidoferrum sp.]|nr:monovalent cation/H(+) antiporter subunit G [Candidatus Acidoferrum sp.]